MNTLYRLLFLMLAVDAFAATKIPVMAVLPLQSRGLDSNTTRILEEALSDGLVSTGKIRLLERSQVKNILAEQGFQQSGACSGSECVVQIGRLLGVERGVVGSIGLLGKTYVFNARIIDIGTGEVLATSQRSLAGKIDDALTDLVPQVVSDLTKPAGKPGKDPAGAPKASASHWGWWTAGGILVAGGAAAAAFVLLNEPKSTPQPAPSQNQNPDPVVDPTGTLTFRWN